LERAKAMDEGRPFPPSRGITFESPAEMVRLLTPARLDLFSKVKNQTFHPRPRSVAGPRCERSAPAMWTRWRRLDRVFGAGGEPLATDARGLVSAPASISVSAEL